MEEERIQIADVEDFRGEKDVAFSHQQLVMRAMNKCLEAGCKEMRAGYFNEKQDTRGNIIRVYVEDTRKSFIECVETLEMIMECDLDEEAQKKILKIKNKLDETYKNLCKLEEKDWNECSFKIKKYRWMNGIYYRKGYLNVKLPYYQDYIEEQVVASREIVKELSKLTQRLNYYQEEDFGN